MAQQAEANTELGSSSISFRSLLSSERDERCDFCIVLSGLTDSIFCTLFHLPSMLFVSSFYICFLITSYLRGNVLFSILAPLLVYGRNSPQRGKKTQKSDILFFEAQNLLVQPCKMTAIGFFTRMRTCAPSNRDVDFLLSQVSHVGRKSNENEGKCCTTMEQKTRFSPLFSSEFGA